MAFIRKAPKPSRLRAFATQAIPAPKLRLNVPIDFDTTPLLHHTQKTFAKCPGLPTKRALKRLNLYQSVNSALRTALGSPSKVLCFGEDVAFCGVFRCTTGLKLSLGPTRSLILLS